MIYKSYYGTLMPFVRQLIYSRIIVVYNYLYHISEVYCLDLYMRKIE
jgi:hypothetical protein